MALSLFGGHAKCVGAHSDVGRPAVCAVITRRKILVDDRHTDPVVFSYLDTALGSREIEA